MSGGSKDRGKQIEGDNVGTPNTGTRLVEKRKKLSANPQKGLTALRLSTVCQFYRGEYHLSVTRLTVFQCKKDVCGEGKGSTKRMSLQCLSKGHTLNCPRYIDIRTHHTHAAQETDAHAKTSHLHNCKLKYSGTCLRWSLCKAATSLKQPDSLAPDSTKALESISLEQPPLYNGQLAHRRLS